jgi:hypothetical protein
VEGRAVNPDTSRNGLPSFGTTYHHYIH